MENEWKSTLINTSVIIGALLGGCALLMMYIINLFKNADKEVPPKKNEKGTEQPERKRETTVHGNKGKKKTADSRWGGRSDKQGFSHPWLLTSLKGHTGQVLDMDFSGNGKYLASCAEEDIDPGGDPNGDGGTSSSSSDGNKETSRTSSADDPSPQTKGLSRRQRKNRRRDDASPSDTKKKVKPKRPEVIVKKPLVVVPLKQWLKLKLLERDLVTFLRSYLLSPEQMLTMGYPVESSLLPGRAIIFKSPISVPAYTPSHYRLSKFDVNRSRFDVNAQEFVPSYCSSVGLKDNDSGQGSGSSSDSGENLDDSESSSSSSIDIKSSSSTKRVTKLNAPERKFVPVIRPRFDGSIGHTCMRCGAGFYTKNNEYVTVDPCAYHWGKLQSVIAPGSGKHHRTYGFAYEYSCCQGNQNSKGCTIGRAHVWSGINVGFNGPYDSYTRTRPRKTPPHDGNYGVYALDCEMCFTVKGLELTKITVVGADGRLVYDSFVKPDNEIIDYNTRFSGITAKDLGKKSVTKTLREVQNDLMGFINADTILIGHGLENDLRALRIIHNTVVDTAVCFPHYNGLPYRRSLKSLTSCFLKTDIQTAGAAGHNSYEDARACMELMLWRVRKDFRGILEHVQ